MVPVSAVSNRLGFDGYVLPVVGSEPFEEWAERWHAGSDQGEVVLDAAVFMVNSGSARQGRNFTHNKVTTRYWAKVASVVPRDWTAKATRIAQAIEALVCQLVADLSSERFAFSAAGNYINPARNTNSKYILCGHEMRSLITIGMGKLSMMASATRSRPPIAKVSLP